MESTPTIRMDVVYTHKHKHLTVFNIGTPCSISVHVSAPGVPWYNGGLSSSRTCAYHCSVISSSEIRQKLRSWTCTLQNGADSINQGDTLRECWVRLGLNVTCSSTRIQFAITAKEVKIYYLVLSLSENSKHFALFWYTYIYIWGISLTVKRLPLGRKFLAHYGGGLIDSIQILVTWMCGARGMHTVLLSLYIGWGNVRLSVEDMEV